MRERIQPHTQPPLAPRRPRHRLTRTLLAALLALGLSTVLSAAPALAAAAKPSTPATQHPGYLDFGELGFDANAENLRVEVSLQDAVLAFVTETLRPTDAELAEALSKIRSIRFQLYRLTPQQAAAAGERSRSLADRLERRGWQRVVRIQEDGTQSYLHLKMEGNRILGLTVMFLNHGEEGDGFGFINIAGEIDPAQLGRIGQRFDIEVLEEAQRKLNPEAQ
jgi:hypothetical protein